MDTKSLIAKTIQALGILVLSFASASVLAQPEFGRNPNFKPGTTTPSEEGTGIDQKDPSDLSRRCFGLNKTKPSAAYANYLRITDGANGSRCNLCHNENNRSISMLPEWDWWKAGWLANPDPNNPKPMQQNFCYVQGIIEAPAAIPDPNPDNIPIPVFSKGSTLALKARAFSPRGSASPLTYTVSFDDGRSPIDVTPSPANKGNHVTINVPLPNVNPKLKITLTAKDSTGEVDSTPDSREIIVSDEQAAANPDNYSVNAGSTLSVSAKDGVLTNDSPTGPGWPPLQATPVDYPVPEKPGDPTPEKHGSLTLSPNGNFSYTPNPGFVGKEYFTYKASNGFMESAPGTVTLTVTAAPPVANPDRYSVQPGTNPTPEQDVLANDKGTPPLFAVKTTDPSKGGKLVLTKDANDNWTGVFQYTPPSAGFTGTDSFTYKASNGSVTSKAATVTLEVGSSCTDRDKDGYSPEGGSCGPKDCDDMQPTRSPGLKEICTNKLDDDCNKLVDQADPACPGYTDPTTDGTAPADCIGKLTANQVRIDSANWSADLLTVTGSKAKAGNTVIVYKMDTRPVGHPDYVAPVELGRNTVTYNGSWKVEWPVAGIDNAPCRVQAQILENPGPTGARAVTGASAKCANASDNAPPSSCGFE